jgi:hypothetical protein
MLAACAIGTFSFLYCTDRYNLSNGLKNMPERRYILSV